MLCLYAKVFSWLAVEIPHGSYMYWSDFCIIIYIIGTPSEILMKGDHISFIGEVWGNYTFTTVLGKNITMPCLGVSAETLKVLCSE